MTTRALKNYKPYPFFSLAPSFFYLRYTEDKTCDDIPAGCKEKFYRTDDPPFKTKPTGTDISRLDSGSFHKSKVNPGQKPFLLTYQKIHLTTPPIQIGLPYTVFTGLF